MMSATSKPIIIMENVSKIYNVGGEEVRALDGASLTIYEGEFVSIIGPSGSGKTTMMNIIGCLDVTDEGEYILDGQSIEKYSDKELAGIRNKKIGFVFQSFNLLSRMTATRKCGTPSNLSATAFRYKKRKDQYCFRPSWFSR